MTFVMRTIADTVLPDYSEIISEHEKITSIKKMRDMLTTAKTFGTSEFFGEFANEGYGFNLAKIFGYYGWVTGVIIIILLVVFMISLLIGYKKTKPVRITTAIIIITSTVTGIANNLGIYTVVDSSVPVVSLLPEGFLTVGLTIGAVFASEKAVYKS